ncbi:MAG: type II secretion system protein, partial [bacterium]
VVIAIIGLLSTIAFISLNRARAKARDAKRISDVRELQSALELYYNDQTSPGYPQSNSAVVLSSTLLGTTYVASIPTAPTPAESNCIVTAVDYNPYTYKSYASQTDNGVGYGWYRIQFCLGGASGGLTLGCIRAEPSGMSNVACAALP